jgi:hypothetical protein
MRCLPSGGRFQQQRRHHQRLWDYASQAIAEGVVAYQ